MLKSEASEGKFLYGNLVIVLFFVFRQLRLVNKEYFYTCKEPLEIHAFQKLCEKHVEQAKEQLIKK